MSDLGKNFKKSFKKVLTKAKRFGIIIRHSSKESRKNKISTVFQKKTSKKFLKKFKKVLTKEKQYDIINKLSARENFSKAAKDLEN